MKHVHILVTLLTISIISPTFTQELYPEIFRAASAGDIPKLKRLIAQGVDVDMQDEEFNASVLHWAVGKCPQHVRMACVRFLVEEAGANIYARALHNISAAELAASDGDVELAEYLIKRSLQKP